MARKVDFHMVRADTAPELIQQLKEKNEAGELVNSSLEEAATVFFNFYDADDTELWSTEAVVLTTGGKVAYYWQDGDTDYEPGYYKGAWVVTYDDGTVRTFPNPSSNVIRIKDPGS